MIYEYKCNECKKKKELELSLTEYEETQDPICCDVSMNRIYNTAIASDGHGGLHWRKK